MSLIRLEPTRTVPSLIKNVFFISGFTWIRNAHNDMDNNWISFSHILYVNSNLIFKGFAFDYKSQFCHFFPFISSSIESCSSQRSTRSPLQTVRLRSSSVKGTSLYHLFSSGDISLFLQKREFVADKTGKTDPIYGAAYVKELGTLRHGKDLRS